MQGPEEKGMQALLATKFRATWQGPTVPDDLIKRSTAGIAKGWLDYKVGALKASNDIKTTHVDNDFYETYGRRCYEHLSLDSPDEQDELVEVLCDALRQLIARDGMENVNASEWRAVPVFSPHLP
jgi:hypothetical protein